MPFGNDESDVSLQRSQASPSVTSFSFCETVTVTIDNYCIEMLRSTCVDDMVEHLMLLVCITCEDKPSKISIFVPYWANYQRHLFMNDVVIQCIKDVRGSLLCDARVS